ncbi:hypothetical protein B0H13DRAFT_1892225 [Mycena leptocephala]|nr:hypothetical protein B0H13DRAFT_1892225 [Mycena leptocephala]
MPTTSDANILVHTHTCGHQAAMPTFTIYTTLKYTMTLTTPRARYQSALLLHHARGICVLELWRMDNIPTPVRSIPLGILPAKRLRHLSPRSLSASALPRMKGSTFTFTSLLSRSPQWVPDGTEGRIPVGGGNEGLGGSSLRQKREGKERTRYRDATSVRAHWTDEDGDGDSDKKTKLLHCEDGAPGDSDGEEGWGWVRRGYEEMSTKQRASYTCPRFGRASEGGATGTGDACCGATARHASHDTTHDLPRHLSARRGCTFTFGYVASASASSSHPGVVFTTSAAQVHRRWMGK